MRYFHGFETRQRSNRNVGFSRMTRRNVTVLTEEYRDGAAALEKRMQLIVGLHHIAKGSPKPYVELRKFSLRNLYENITSAKNPQLHFLVNTANPVVRKPWRTMEPIRYFQNNELTLWVDQKQFHGPSRSSSETQYA